MNKYATFKVYYCKKTREYLQVPHSDINDTLEKYAAEGLILEEIVDPYEPDALRIVQPQ